MDQTPSWKANSFSSDQEITRVLWGPAMIIMFTVARNL
jgi:hypothetical protein